MCGSSCGEDCSWREQFIRCYADLGRYVDIYPKIYKAWQQIETYMKKYCPTIYESIQGNKLFINIFVKSLIVATPQL